MNFRGRKIKVDPKNTLYAQAKIPESDEEIIKYFQNIRNALVTRNIDDSMRLIDKDKAFPQMIREIDLGLEEYDRSGKITDFLSRVSIVNYLLQQAYLKGCVKKNKLTNQEVYVMMNDMKRVWDVLCSEDAKKTYDFELFEIRKIEAAKDAEIKKAIYRNKFTREELIQKYGKASYDKSYLGGDKIVTTPGNLPWYAWNIKEYEDGKHLILHTETHYEDHPELDQKVEVYSHGEFMFGSMLRSDEYGRVSPTVSNELCEIVSIKKIDKNGNFTTTYGIAQTRELGYFKKLTEAEIRKIERSGRQVLLVSTEEDIRERENVRIQELNRRRRRRSPEAYEIVSLRTETEFGKKLKRFNRTLDKIGLEIPDMFIPKQTIEKRVPIQNASVAIKDIVPEPIRDPLKKHNVLIMEPVRYSMNPMFVSDFAKLQLSDILLQEALKKNGGFFGIFSDDLNSRDKLVEDETIRACQFATVNRGTVQRAGMNGLYTEVSNIMKALEYIARRDRMMEQQKAYSSNPTDSAIEHVSITTQKSENGTIPLNLGTSISIEKEQIKEPNNSNLRNSEYIYGE